MSYTKTLFNILCMNAVSLLIHFTAPAQTYYVIKIDGVGLLDRNLRVIRPSVERTITHGFSAVLTYENGKYMSGTTQQGFYGSPKEEYKVFGWGIMPEIRYYPFSKKKAAPSGFLGGLFFRYRKVNEKYDGDDKASFNGGSNNKKIHIQTRGTAYNNGIAMGYKFIIDVLTFEILAGYGAAWGNWESPNERNQIPEFYKGSLSDPFSALRLEISLGLIFPKYRNKKAEQDTSLHN